MSDNKKFNSSIEIYKEELLESCVGGKDIPEIIKEVPYIFETLSKMIKDVDLTNEQRMLSYATIGYFFIPDDLYPEETLGQIGYVDDVILSLTIFNEIRSNNLGKDILNRNWTLNLGIDEVMDIIYPSLIKSFPKEYVDVLDHVGLLPNEIDLVID